MTVALHPTTQLPFPYPTEYQGPTDNRRPPQRPLGGYAPLKHIKREVREDDSGGAEHDGTGKQQPAEK